MHGKFFQNHPKASSFIAKTLVIAFVLSMPLAEGCNLMKSLKKKGIKKKTEQVDSTKTMKKQDAPRKNEKGVEPQKKAPVEGEK